MRIVKFIELQIKDIVAMDYVEYHEHHRPDNFSIALNDCNEYDYLDTDVKKYVVPVHHIVKSENGVVEDTFIAYSKDVENYLKIPISIIIEENKGIRKAIGYLNTKNDNLNNKINKIEKDANSCSLINRIKYMVTGKIKHISK